MFIKKKPSRKKNTHYRSRKYITKEEFDILISKRIKTKRESQRRIDRYKSILYLLYYHALRCSELVELKWDAIDMVSKTIHITRLKNGKSSIHPLMKCEYPVLKRLYDIRKGFYVLEGPMGDQMPRASVNSFFFRLNKKKLIPLKLHPHMLRHGCGYYLANKGIDTRSIQVYMGHSCIKSTAIYTEISPNRFNDFFTD